MFLRIGIIILDNVLFSEDDSRLIDFVSDRRQKKIKNFRDAQGKKNALYAELLLRVLLKDSGIEEWKSKEYYVTKQGKPFFLSEDNLYLSISHSCNCIMCGITDVGNIGVDVEKISDMPYDIFEMVLQGNEVRMILDETSETDRKNFFYKIWTAKEAYGKYSGEGLCSLSEMDFRNKKNLYTWIEHGFAYSVYTENRETLCIKYYTEEEVRSCYD